jgi:hypothetical protein
MQATCCTAELSILPTWPTAAELRQTTSNGQKFYSNFKQRAGVMLSVTSTAQGNTQPNSNTASQTPATKANSYLRVTGSCALLLARVFRVQNTVHEMVHTKQQAAASGHLTWFHLADHRCGRVACCIAVLPSSRAHISKRPWPSKLPPL